MSKLIDPSGIQVNRYTTFLRSYREHVYLIIVDAPLGIGSSLLSLVYSG